MSSEVTLEYAQGKTTTEFGTFEEAVMFMKDVAGDASVRELQSISIMTYVGHNRMGFHEYFVNANEIQNNLGLFVLRVIDGHEQTLRLEQKSKM
jgi:hypothetical protein